MCLILISGNWEQYRKHQNFRGISSTAKTKDEVKNILETSTESSTVQINLETFGTLVFY